MSVPFAHVALDRYYRYGTDLFQTPSIMEQSQFITSLRANNSDSVGPSGVRSGEKMVSDVVVVDADEKDLELNRVMTAAEASVSSFEGKPGELETEYRAVHTKGLIGLVDVRQIAKRKILLEK